MQATQDAIARRATDSGAGGDTTEWLPCPEGVWRFIVGEPLVEQSGFFNKDGSPKWRAVFPLGLTESEYARAKAEVEVSDGQQVSGKVKYRVGLSFGWYKDGAYNSTMLVDFLCCCLGKEAQKRLRQYVEAGGGPADMSQPGITAWLQWFREAEVYGTIGHDDDRKVPGRVWNRFSGPMAVGSLPGQKDDAYQAWGRGRLKALMAEGAGDEEAAHAAVDEARFEELKQQQPAPTGGVDEAEYQHMFGDGAGN